MMQINKEAREREWSELNQWAWQPMQMMVINFYSLYALFCFSTLYLSEIWSLKASMSHMLSTVGVFLVWTQSSVSTLSFTDGTVCSLFVQFYSLGFFSFVVYFLIVVVHIFCACMCVTVVVRSQVVVLVLRGSVAEETQCPYQEAGWTGNPAENTNVMLEIINLTCSLASTVQVQNIPMQKVGGTRSLFWVKKARKSDGCLIRAK